MSSTSSPLRNNTGFCLSKHTVCEFSPFFKKGVFEYGSHGTGWLTVPKTKVNWKIQNVLPGSELAETAGRFLPDIPGNEDDSWFYQKQNNKKKTSLTLFKKSERGVVKVTTERTSDEPVSTRRLMKWLGPELSFSESKRVYGCKSIQGYPLQSFWLFWTWTSTL